MKFYKRVSAIFLMLTVFFISMSLNALPNEEPTETTSAASTSTEATISLLPTISPTLTPSPEPTQVSTSSPILKPQPTKNPTQLPNSTNSSTSSSEYVYNFTYEEKIMFATLLKLEAGSQSWECQLAVGSVVLNRLDRKWGGKTTLKGIIYAKGQFSPANKIPYNKPTQTQLDVVEYLCKNGVVDKEIVFFYYERYSEWGTPCYHIGTEYFSKT